MTAEAQNLPSTRPEDLPLAQWKGQLDTALRAIEAIVEGSRKIREMQLEAAVEAHARAEATRQLLARAASSEELFKIQSEWMSANLQRALSYWRDLYGACLETESCVADCLCHQTDLFSPQAHAAVDTPQGALAEMVDRTYKRWLEATREFYTGAAVSREQPLFPPAQAREIA